MFNPQDLLTAFSLAKLQEENVRVGKKGIKNFTLGKIDHGGNKGSSSHPG